MLAATRLKKFNEASARIGGYTGALALLEQLPDAVARKVLKPAMKTADLVGAMAAHAEAEKHANPRRRGGVHLADTAGAAEAARGDTVIGKVGYFGQAGSHGWLVEHGHRMVVGGTVARISGRRKGQTDKGKHWWSRGAGRVVSQVPPHPILQPAYQESKSAMEQAFAAEVIARADKVARQLAQQTGAVA